MESVTLAYILIGVGILLLFAEFVLPTGGILAGLGLFGMIFGVGMTFMYGDPSTGMIALVLAFVVVPILGGVALRYWPQTRMGQRFILNTPGDDDATVATMPVNIELEQLRGRFGRAVSALRPSGVVEFDGRRVDTITEGLMIDEGQWVRCIDVKAGKVVVRAADKPDLGRLESVDLS